MLIKSAKSDRLLKEAVVLDMGDLARQADRILANARLGAAQIHERARVESERLVASADERGHAQGYERGLEDGRVTGEAAGRNEAFEQHSQGLQDLMKRWDQALQRWEQQRQDMMQDAREDVVRFAYALARKVVLRLPLTDPSIVLDQVAAALKAASRSTSIEIAINPTERPLLEQALPRLLESASRFQHAVIREDQSMAIGGCVVRTGHGAVDATLEAQLERIAEALVPSPDTNQGDEAKP